MKKCNKNKLQKVIVFILLFVILLMSNNVYAVSNSLDDFIKNNNVGNMTKEQIDKKVQSIKFTSEIQKQNCISNVATILQNADAIKDLDERIKFVENEFKAQCKYVENANDAFYLYYGYMLGQKKVEIQKTQSTIGDTSKNNDETLHKKFKSKYDEYTKLSKKKQEDYSTASQYYSDLKAILDQYSKSSKYYIDDAKLLDKIHDIVLQKEPTQTEQDNKNGKGEKDGVLGESSASANHSIDEIIGEAQSFMKKGDATTVNSEGLQEASNTVYNILLAVGIVLAVIIGIFLALKFMFSSVEDQAKVKESLIPYIVGCVVVFGAFIIWKLAIVILRGIS